MAGRPRRGREGRRATRGTARGRGRRRLSPPPTCAAPPHRLARGLSVGASFAPVYLVRLALTPCRRRARVRTAAGQGEGGSLRRWMGLLHRRQRPAGEHEGRREPGGGSRGGPAARARAVAGCALEAERGEDGGGRSGSGGRGCCCWRHAGCWGEGTAAGGWCGRERGSSSSQRERGRRGGGLRERLASRRLLPAGRGGCVGPAYVGD